MDPLPTVPDMRAIIGEQKAKPSKSEREFILPSGIVPRSGLALHGGRSKRSAAGAHGLTELLPFLRCHLLPSLHHVAPPAHGRSRAAAEAAEQDLAEDQQPKRLPVANGMQAKQGRHEPIPQAHNDQAKDGCEDDRKQSEPYSSQDSIAFHVFWPHGFVNSS